MADGYFFQNLSPNFTRCVKNAHWQKFLNKEQLCSTSSIIIIVIIINNTMN